MKDLQEEVRQDWEQTIKLAWEVCLSEYREKAQAAGFQPLTYDECRLKYGGALALPPKEDKVFIIPDHNRLIQCPDYFALRDFGKDYPHNEFQSLVQRLFHFYEEYPNLFETILQSELKDFRRKYLKSIISYIKNVKSHSTTISNVSKNNSFLLSSKITKPLANAVNNLAKSVSYAEAMRDYLKKLDAHEITTQKKKRKDITSLNEWNSPIMDTLSFLRNLPGETLSDNVCATKIAELFRIVYPMYWNEPIPTLSDRIHGRIYRRI